MECLDTTESKSDYRCHKDEYRGASAMNRHRIQRDRYPEHTGSRHKDPNWSSLSVSIATSERVRLTEEEGTVEELATPPPK